MAEPIGYNIVYRDEREKAVTLALWKAAYGDDYGPPDCGDPEIGHQMLWAKWRDARLFLRFYDELVERGLYDARCIKAMADVAEQYRRDAYAERVAREPADG